MVLVLASASNPQLKRKRPPERVGVFNLRTEFQTNQAAAFLFAGLLAFLAGFFGAAALSSMN